MSKLAVVLSLAATIAGASGSASAFTTGFDSTFGTGGIALIGPTPVSGIVMRRVSSLLVDPNGKIAIGGYVWDSVNNAELPAVGRLNADASWDTSFGDHGVFAMPYGSAAAPYGGRVDKLGVFSDGSVLASGGRYDASHSLDYATCTVLVRLTTSGNPDSGFGPDNSGSYCFDFAPPPPDLCCIHYHWDDIKIDSDDSFFLTTTTTNLDGDVVRGAIAHFDASGALLSPYGASGIAAISPNVAATNQIEILPDHSVVAVGITATADDLGLGTSQVDPDGAVDLNYGANGAAATDLQGQADIGIPDAVLDPQLRVLIASYSHTPDFGDSSYRLARLTSSGSVDETFNGNGMQAGTPGVAVLTLSPDPTYDSIQATRPLADGHILVVGQNGKVTDTDGTWNISLLRLNEDGSWDASFGDAVHPGWASVNIAGKASSYGAAESIGDDPHDARILVGIVTGDANDNACIGLLRIVPDRLIDSDFESATAMPVCPQ